MVYVLMNDPATGRVAVYDELDTVSDPENPNSSRNAPLNNPVPYLSRVRFHNEFDYYQVHSITDVTVTHAAVPGVTVAVSAMPPFSRQGQISKSNRVLLNHGLPYRPSFMVASGGTLIGQSSKIQVAGTGLRSISPYATSGQICLLDYGVSSGADLPALTKTYRVIVFRQPVATSPWMADIDPDAGVFQLGYGKWNGALRQLRTTLLGDASPFDLPRGRTSDIRGGYSRTVLADGTVHTSPGYTGAFAGSPSIECTVE